MKTEFDSKFKKILSIPEIRFRKMQLMLAAVITGLILAAATAVIIYNSASVFVGEGLFHRTRFSVFAKEIDVSGMGLDDVSPLSRCKRLEKLDIRGNDVSLEDYEKLAGSLENCDILWDIPFQDGKLDSRVSSITISELKKEDIEALKLLGELEEIDASGCEMSELLPEAKRQLDNNITWKVTALGKVLDRNVKELNFEKTGLKSMDEFEYMLEFCPSVESVDLTGSGLSADEMIALRKIHPDAGIHWSFNFFGNTVSTVEELIDISNKRVKDIAAFRKLLDNFSRIDKLVMCDCDVSNEEMEKLCNDYPDIKFVWRVYLGTWSIRTDAKYFSTNISKKDAYRLKSTDIEVLKYCTELEHLDIGHSLVSDISALSGLTNLKTLIIASGGEGVTDITPLSGMVHMQYLELFLNHITDISPLANMHELLDLNLTFNEISDITPLLGLERLERCWISQNNISEDDMRKLEDTLPKCEFNFTVGAATDGGWRLHERYFEMREFFGYSPDNGRLNAHCPRPYEVQPENYLTHYNIYYSERNN